MTGIIIEPVITDLAIGGGETLILNVEVFGRQDILDNDLADLVSLNWGGQPSGREF